jgi:hypothetical protein
VTPGPHVLVARQDSAGDVLLAGPAVRAVAAGAGKVTLLCGGRGREAAGLLPGVDEVLVRQAPWIDADPEPVTRPGVDALVDELAAAGIDQAFVLTSFHQSPLPLALLLRMAGVPTVAAVSVDYPGSLLDIRHRVADDLHEVERMLSLVGTLGYRLPDGDDGRLRVRRAPGGARGGPPVDRGGPGDRRGGPPVDRGGPPVDRGPGCWSATSPPCPSATAGPTWSWPSTRASTTCSSRPRWWPPCRIWAGSPPPAARW